MWYIVRLTMSYIFYNKSIRNFKHWYCFLLNCSKFSLINSLYIYKDLFWNEQVLLPCGFTLKATCNLRNVAFSFFLFFSFATKGNYIAKLGTGLVRNYVCKNTKMIDWDSFIVFDGRIERGLVGHKSETSGHVTRSDILELIRNTCLEARLMKKVV